MVYLFNGIVFSMKIIYVIMWMNLENVTNVSQLSVTVTNSFGGKVYFCSGGFGPQ